MKNLIGTLFLGAFLYLIMGGTFPTVVHHVDDDAIIHGDNSVNKDDVFFGVHVIRNEDGSHKVAGVSHRGQLLKNKIWANLFRRAPSVHRSLVAQQDAKKIQESLPCDVTFLDVPSGHEADLLGDLCIVRGSGTNEFNPQKTITRGAVAKMVAGAMMYVRTGDAKVVRDPSVPIPDDTPALLAPYVAQLNAWGLLTSLSRDSQSFGANDIMTREAITTFLLTAIDSLPSDIVRSEALRLPLHQHDIARGEFATMLVDAFNLRGQKSSLALATY